jgi:hypothetical protein
MLIEGGKQSGQQSDLISEGRAKTPLIKALVACILATALIFAATQIGWFSSFVAPLVVISGGIVLYISWRNWEFGVQALLVLVVFEGAIRKWFLPSASELVYFYKDFIMLAALIGYLSRRNKPPLLIKQRLQPLLVIIVAFFAYALASISNPRIPHPLVGLFGVKAYCLYIPLVFMVPRMFPNKEKLIAFLRWYLLLALPVVVLGVTQFRTSDTTSSLNRYAWNQDAADSGNAESGIAAFEDSEGNTYVRVTGTFSYLSGLAIYLPVVFAMLLGITEVSSRRDSPRLLKWIFYFSLAAVAATGFMTGSRSTIVNFVVITLIFYSLSSMKSLKDRIPQVLIGGALIYITLTVAFPEALDAMKTRALGSQDQITEGSGRIEGLFRLPLDEAALAGAFGYGIGTTQNAVPSLMSKLDIPFLGEQIPIGYEDESARVMLDLGIIGYLLFGLLRLILLLTLWRACLVIKDPMSKPLAVAALSILTIHILVGGAVVNHTQNVYQWFLIGVCFALLNAEKLGKAEVSFNRSSHLTSLDWRTPFAPTAPKI